jgi:hypothetical protein
MGVGGHAVVSLSSRLLASTRLLKRLTGLAVELPLGSVVSMRPLAGRSDRAVPGAESDPIGSTRPRSAGPLAELIGGARRFGRRRRGPITVVGSVATAAVLGLLLAGRGHEFVAALSDAGPPVLAVTVLLQIVPLLARSEGCAAARTSRAAALTRTDDRLQPRVHQERRISRQLLGHGPPAQLTHGSRRVAQRGEESAAAGSNRRRDARGLGGRALTAPSADYNACPRVISTLLRSDFAQSTARPHAERRPPRIVSSPATEEPSLLASNRTPCAVIERSGRSPTCRPS